MKCKVTKYHNKKAYRKGDLESEFVMEAVRIFSTKKSALQYLKKEAHLASSKGYEADLKANIRGAFPRLTVRTGEQWVHENTGEKEEEFYSYIASEWHNS